MTAPKAKPVINAHEIRNNPPEVMTTDEMSVYLNVCVPTILRLIKHDNLPARKIGSSYRFVRTAVLQWLTEKAPSNSGTSETSETTEPDTGEEDTTVIEEGEPEEEVTTEEEVEMPETDETDETVEESEEPTTTDEETAETTEQPLPQL